MTEKLNPSEAQRELMIQAILDNSGFGPKSAAHIVDAQIAAANSIPEGAPVGTIARRPDGAFLAIREGCAGTGGWQYWGTGPLRRANLLDGFEDADSWPVIYDPSQGAHTGVVINAETNSRLGEILDNPTKPEPSEVQEALSGLDGTDKSAVKLITGFSDERLEELGGLADPTAQQEPADPLAELTRMAEEDGLYDVTPEEWRIALGEVRRERGTTTPKPRTPRVVGGLGVEHRGSRWRDRDGDEWKFQNGWRWRESADIWAIGMPFPTHAPYTEILEPRVLPSLDCEEARDATIWEYQKDDVAHRVQYSGERWVCLSCDLALTGGELTAWAPYVEVLS